MNKDSNNSDLKHPNLNTRLCMYLVVPYNVTQLILEIHLNQTSEVIFPSKMVKNHRSLIPFFFFFLGGGGGGRGGGGVGWVGVRE